MNLRLKAAVAMGTLSVLTAGGAAAALQSPSALASVTSPHPAIAHKPKMQRGIDVDFYTWKGEKASTVATRAAETIHYLTLLHANAISVSFPFFMSGPRTIAVYGTPATPKPAQLSVLVHDAHKAGLTVSLRPLLASKSLHRSRTAWQPVHQAAWFRSYKAFLRPYLVMAQHWGVAEFIEGSEFSRFDTVPAWHSLSKWVRTIYHRKLACAANWTKIPARICDGGVLETVDAYPAIPHGTLLAGWEHFDKKLRPATVLSEIGIAAAPQARTNPDRFGWPIKKTDPRAQAQWFTAACHAAENEHIGGIYFWSIGVGNPPHGPTLRDQMSWAHDLGQRAITACFTAIQKAGR